MKRVYLDQNKWIDLTAARKQLAKGKPFEDALLVASEGVRRSLVSFPLSSVHYIELSHRANWKSRRDVAETMARLSDFHTIAPPRVLLPAEIDRGLRALFGVPDTPRTARVFGIGASHAFDEPDLTFRVPREMKIDPVRKVELERRAKNVLEWWLLLGPPPGHTSKFVAYNSLVQGYGGQAFAKEKERLRELRKQHGNYRGQRAESVARAQTMVDYTQPLSEALARVGLDSRKMPSALGRDGMTALIEAIPMMYVDSELHRLRDTAAQQAWEPNDLSDLSALTRAVVYCDVVVTEKQWASLIRRARLDERYGTAVIADIRELPALLV